MHHSIVVNYKDVRYGAEHTPHTVYGKTANMDLLAKGGMCRCVCEELLVGPQSGKAMVATVGWWIAGHPPVIPP